MPKAFCYSPKCDFVKTGFNIEQYWVCRFCKVEVDEVLLERKKEERRKEQEKKESIKQDEEEQQDLWTFI